MRNLVRLVAMVFTTLLYLQLQGCSDLPTKVNNEPGNGNIVTDGAKKESSEKKAGAEPDCD